MRSGEVRELEELALGLHAEVAARAMSGMRHAPDAEDIAQESWARMSALVAKGHKIADLRAYLFRVVRNLMIDHHRQQRARMETSASDEILAAIPDPRPNAEAQLVTRDELRRMDAIMAGMPAKARAVFWLARIEGLSYAEIGRRLGVSRQTVHDHMMRALLAIQLAAAEDFAARG
jgi:RNA polymerase sigma factor (sigma-70 family)